MNFPYRSDSTVKNSAARIVTAYKAEHDRIVRESSAEASLIMTRQERLSEALLEALMAEAEHIQEQRWTMPQDQRWEAVSYATFTVDIMEAVGALRVRSPWKGDGMYGLSLQLHCARVTLGYYPTAEERDEVQRQLLAAYGPFPVEVGYFESHNPTRM